MSACGKSSKSGSGFKGLFSVARFGTPDLHSLNLYPWGAIPSPDCKVALTAATRKGPFVFCWRGQAPSPWPKDIPTFCKAIAAGPVFPKPETIPSRMGLLFKRDQRCLQLVSTFSQDRGPQEMMDFPKPLHHGGGGHFVSCPDFPVVVIGVIVFGKNPGQEV